ncbi:ATP-binding protein [Hoeflea prorocentri]|uniref:histidine kinase n=1 Tax=Hoeflea prorocentri TaxID=1922333 RepID=A0A9X3UIR1_9HYPH|nr:ATP-binding protein [Hoeflea prorocentri]MCY6381170.1 ATP-binding protein [Hoeflea prorocentri]MDA5398970.1 ATP-binding protein [Hoeflea prorocentri]
MIWQRITLWPRTLAGQLIGLILIALVVSQIFTLWLFTDERRVALIELAGGRVVARTAALVELLDDTPPQLHDQLRRAASSPLSHYWISNRPALEKSGENRTDQRIRRALTDEIGEDRDVRTQVGPNIEIPRYHRGKPRADRPEKKSATRRVPLVVAMSVQLESGRWLNMASSLNMQRSSLERVFASIGIMAIAVIVIVGFTVRRLTKPLRNLADAADQLGRGAEGLQVAEAGPHEVRSAIHAFNVMQERLTRYVQDRTKMLAAISHDLRTPITSLRIRAEFVEDEENRDRIIQTLDEMQRMVEATLAFARDEASGEQQSRVDLGEFLDAIVTDYQDMGQPVQFDGGLSENSGRIIVTCRPLAIKRALRNLIDNAVRYGGEAGIGLSDDERSVRITISDKGPGIPEDRLDEVFEPFLRLEDSRSEETGGIGLGLAIARSNIHAHGGTLKLTNREQGGLTATVVLPKG